MSDDDTQNKDESNSDDTTTLREETAGERPALVENTTHEQSITTTRTIETTAARTKQRSTDRSTTVTPISTSKANGKAETTDTSNTSSVRGTWEEKAPLPVVQSDAGGGVLDGKLYFFGGIETATGLDAVTRAFAYDLTDGVNGSWDRIEDLPRALWGNCGVATDSALYSFGGAPQDAPYLEEPPSDAIFKYTSDDGWEDLTSIQGVRCPYRNWVMKGVHNPVDGLIYCVGGGTAVTDRPSATDHGLDDQESGTYDESRIWTFDPATEQIRNPDLARMPEAKRWISVALVEVDEQQYIHAIGGLLGTTGPTDSNFRYDIAAGRWEWMQPTPRPGTYATHSNPVIQNEVYLTHGMFWEDRSTIDRYELVAHRYDPVADSFSTDLPTPQYLRGGATCGVIDGNLYVVGGHLKRFDQNGLHDAVAYNESFTPPKQ